MNRIIWCNISPLSKGDGRILFKWICIVIVVIIVILLIEGMIIGGIK